MVKIIHIIRCILLTVAAGVGFEACNSNDCPLNNTVRLVCGFYDVANASSTDIEDTLTISVRDSVILNRATGTATVSLPMSYSGDADTLVFTFTPAGVATGCSDTLIVCKTNQPHITSLECGASVFHTITAINYTRRTPTETYRYAIDSVAVSNAEANFDGKENLKIYFTHY